MLKKIAASLALSAFLFLGRIIAAPGSTSSDEWISFSFRPDVSMRVLRYIASVAKPSTEVLSAKETLQHLLRRHYGSSHEKIRALFHDFNPTVRQSTIPAGTRVVLPAAPWWEFNKVKDIRDDSSLAEEMAIQLGFAGKKSRRAVRLANPQRPFSWHGLAKLPYVARLRTFELRPEFRGRRKEIERHLTVDPAIAVNVGPPMALEPELESLGSTVGCISPDEAFWPLPELTARHAAALHSAHNTAIVAILDSGLPSVPDSRLNLWMNRIEAHGTTDVDDDGNGLVDDVYGYDFAEHRMMPNDDLYDDMLRGHGLHVAGIASGRLSPATTLPDLDTRVRLMILKIADRNSDVKTQPVTDAIAYADDHDANIVNLSLSGIEKDVEDAIASRRRILFVVAAGNGDENHVGMNIDNVPVYPTQLTKSYPNVISVAAQNIDGTIACFSNYGSSTVDVAAPGVKVPSLGPVGEVRLSGTSQATPLVTFVSSLLFSLGIRTPADIKRRIIASVDYDPALAANLTSGGRLNVEKAVSIDDDLVELPDAEHTLLHGTIDGVTSLTLTHPNRTIPFRNIMKVVRADSAGRYRVSWIDRGITKAAFGAPQGEFTITLKDGMRRTLAFHDVADLIPATSP